MSDRDDRTLKYRNDPRSSHELIRLVLTMDADEDDNEYWHPVYILQDRLPQIIESVRELTESGDAKSRETGATILGQSGVRDKCIVSQCVDLLLCMIRQEQDNGVLSSIAHAMGQLHDPRCINALVFLTQHPCSDVRYAVVHGLLSYEDFRAIQALITLSTDQDQDVRNWATFGIGSMIETDIPKIRDALFARLGEADSEIRGEALVGLARRSDLRIVAPLLQELASTSPGVLRKWVLIGEAADSITRIAQEGGDKNWLPILEKLKELGIGDALAIEVAIERCTLKQL